MAIVKKESMREQCYEIVKEKILRQEYDLGEAINIMALTNELQVSNTPIREALTQLVKDGLVRSELNSKARVISFTSMDFTEMAQTIDILVSGAYRLCVRENKLDALIPLISACLEKQREHFEAGDFYAFTHESVNFDRAFFEALGNRRLLSVFCGLADILFLIYRTHQQKNESAAENSIREHQTMLEAIKNNEYERVNQLMHEHYNKSMNEV